MMQDLNPHTDMVVQSKSSRLELQVDVLEYIISNTKHLS